jgi:hypothetical protein
MSVDRIPDLDDIGNIFFRDGFNLARKYLAGRLSTDRLTMLMTAAYEAVDGLIISFRNRCLREGLDIDCHKGCSWCCHQAVLASTQEVLLISRYLSEAMGEERQQAVLRDTREKEAVTGSMSVMEFLNYLHPCPFLRDRACTIYPVRPMACRIYLSSDVGSCLALYRMPGDPQIIAALYDFPLRAGRSINEGIRAVLVQQGIITSEWLLEVLISKSLSEAGIFDKWLSGGDPFAIRALSAEENDYLREYWDRQESFKDGD